MNETRFVETSPVHEGPPRKGERLRRMLERLDRLKPAANLEEAHAMITKVFEDIERDAGVPEDDRMEVYPIEKAKELQAQQQRVLYQIYNHHVMFFGGNGALDIRLIDKTFPVTDSLLEKRPTFPTEKMRVTFQKAGKDGREVWG